MSESNASVAISLRAGVATDRGHKREINEDSYLCADPVYAVADGMGGHESGEVASAVCVEVLNQRLVKGESGRDLSATDVAKAVHAADTGIRERTFGRAGTTVTGVVVIQEEGQPYWLIFNVGDSRTYRLREGALEQVSVDHTEVHELQELGQITAEEAAVHPRRHVVTRGLGMGHDNEADYWQIPLQPADRYLVCSDGLTNEIDDAGILTLLSEYSEPQEAAEALVRQSLANGGRDNVTVLVVDAIDGGATGTPRPSDG